MAIDDDSPASIDQRIWMTVCAIPVGKIATYGDVAQRAGLPGAARRVGAALRKLPRGSAVPWYRVVNASGRSSLPPGSAGADRQRALLAEEGVLLGAGGPAKLRSYRWLCAIDPCLGIIGSQAVLISVPGCDPGKHK